jgi:hypothetical protein
MPEPKKTYFRVEAVLFRRRHRRALVRVSVTRQDHPEDFDFLRQDQPCGIKNKINL